MMCLKLLRKIKLDECEVEYPTLYVIKKKCRECNVPYNRLTSVDDEVFDIIKDKIIEHYEYRKFLLQKETFRKSVQEAYLNAHNIKLIGGRPPRKEGIDIFYKNVVDKNKMNTKGYMLLATAIIKENYKDSEFINSEWAKDLCSLACISFDQVKKRGIK